MQTMYPGQVNSPQTELAAAIDDTQDTIEILNGEVLPDAPNLAVLGAGEMAETVLYGAKEGNVLSNITRGFQGEARAWSQGTKVARNLTAYDWDSARTNIEDHETRLAANETGLSQANSEISQLDYQVGNITADIGELQGEINQTNQTVAAHLAEDASLTQKGHVQLSSSVTSTSETLAATPKAVKTAMDRADAAFTQANDIKSKWASVIGSPLSATDTQALLQSKTQTIKNTLATNLTNKGQVSTGTETLTALVNKVANVNTGKKFASGSTNTIPNTNRRVEVRNLTFRPSLIVVEEPSLGDEYGSSRKVFVESRDSYASGIVYYGSDQTGPRAIFTNYWAVYADGFLTDMWYTNAGSTAYPVNWWAYE